MPDTFQHRLFTVFASLVGLVISAVLLWIGRVIFLLLFAAIIGATLLYAVSHILSQRLRLPRGLSLLLFLIVLGSFATVILWLQGPNVLQQFTQLESDLPVAFHHIRAEVQHTTWGNWLLAQSPDADQLTTGARFAITRIGGIVLTSATAIGGLAFTLLLSLYLAAEPLLYYRGLRNLFPQKMRHVLDACTASIRRTLLWWILAKLLSMTVVGILIGLGLWIIGVPLPSLLALIAAMLTFIPNVGPLIALIPAVLLGLAKSPMTGVLTLVVFGIVFLLEGYLVTPLLERNLVRLPPALTLLLQLLLAALAGPVGVALAAPIAAVAIAVCGVLLRE